MPKAKAPRTRKRRQMAAARAALKRFWKNKITADAERDGDPNEGVLSAQIAGVFNILPTLFVPGLASGEVALRGG